MIILPVAVQIAMLSALAGVAGTLNGVLIALFKNDFAPNQDSLIADFTEADYTGYARSTAVVWGTPFINVDGVAEMIAPGKQFQPSGTTVANTIYGYYVVDSGGTDLVYSERFATPVPLAGPLDALPIIPRYLITAIQ